MCEPHWWDSTDAISGAKLTIDLNKVIAFQEGSVAKAGTEGKDRTPCTWLLLGYSSRIPVPQTIEEIWGS